MGSACASDKGKPQSVYTNKLSNGTIGVWGSADGGGKITPTHMASVPATISFEKLPIPLTCTEGGVTADCFWLHAGGTVVSRSVGGNFVGAGADETIYWHAQTNVFQIFISHSVLAHSLSHTLCTCTPPTFIPVTSLPLFKTSRLRGCRPSRRRSVVAG